MTKTLRAWLDAENFDDVNATIANKTTPLMRAALQGDLEMAKEILGEGGAVEAHNSDGNNALWLACVDRRLAMIDLLIDAGVDIDNRNDNGATALMYAASSGRTDVVAHLLARGADISPETLDGFSALDMAANIECLALLRSAQKKSPARV